MLDSLITLSFNKLGTTSRCLSSVVRGTRFQGETELIVVDNGSTDGSKEWLETELPALCAAAGISFRLIANRSNAGCSTARNQALAASSGEFITFLDNDVEPENPDWLSLLRARITSSSSVGMAGAKMLYPPPPPAEGQADSPSVIQCAGVGISRRGHVCFLGRGESDSDKAFSSPREVQCLISACMMIRAGLYHEYGGFDESYNPVQFEDFDLCYRYRSHGWEAWYEPAARMIHHESTTTAGSPSIRNAAVVVRNGLRFQKAWHHLFSVEDGPSEEECRWKKVASSPHFRA